DASRFHLSVIFFALDQRGTRGSAPMKPASKPAIRIDDEPVSPAYEMSIVEVEPGLYSILADGASHEVRVEAGQVTVGNRRFDYAIDDPRQWKRSGGAGGGEGRAAITAPMPGKIVRILAAPGDVVEAGQGIIVVEAMKMQNEMKSPRAGRIASIPVQENESVAAGAVLAVIGPAETAAVKER
ncbi:MAG TPA: biotin/lipoyl-containing protein, partial [Bryobacteraceae bacterium]|nr:biotin/lipoyl-containing protein [Bryobacteraceae bacterium]